MFRLCLRPPVSPKTPGHLYMGHIYSLSHSAWLQFCIHPSPTPPRIYACADSFVVASILPTNDSPDKLISSPCLSISRPFTPRTYPPNSSLPFEDTRLATTQHVVHMGGNSNEPLWMKNTIRRTVGWQQNQCWPTSFRLPWPTPAEHLWYRRAPSPPCKHISVTQLRRLSTLGSGNSGCERDPCKR